MCEFKNKVAVVTGSSGIGLAAALYFAERGAQTFVCGIDETSNKSALEAGSSYDFSVKKVNVAEESEVKHWIQSIGHDTGGIDILVNAAAIQTYGDIESTDSAHWNRLMSINLNGCFLTSHYAYPFMKQRGSGSIIHVSSVQGHSNQDNVLAYATSKGAIHAMTRAMAVDCAKDNIRVNSISPGSVRTPLLEFAAQKVVGEGNDIEPAIKDFGAAHPIGRVGTVDETSALIGFLAGDKSQFCTGGDYKIDGGLTASLGV